MYLCEFVYRCHRGQKRVLDPVTLDSWAVVSHPCGGWDLCKSSRHCLLGPPIMEVYFGIPRVHKRGGSSAVSNCEKWLAVSFLRHLEKRKGEFAEECQTKDESHGGGGLV